MLFWLLAQAILVAFPKAVGHAALGLFDQEGAEPGLLDWLLGFVIILVAVIVIAALQSH